MSDQQEEKVSISLHGHRLYVYVNGSTLKSVCVPGDLMNITKHLTAQEKLDIMEKVKEKKRLVDYNLGKKH